MKKSLLTLSPLFALLVSQAALANPGSFFTMTPSGSAFFVNSTVPGHVYPNAGIKVNTPGASLQNMGTACVPAGNGYCLFSASNNSATPFMLSGSFIGRTPINMSVCLNGTAALSCQSFSPTISYTPRFAYVSTGGSSITLCQVNPTNGYFTNCTLTGNGFSVVSAPISLNPAETFAYLVDSGNNQVDFCSVNTNTGALVNCQKTNAGVTFNAPIGVTVNPAGTFAYVPDEGSGGNLYKCAINQATGNFSGCSPSVGIANGASNVTFNAFGTLAFLATYGGIPITCNADPATGNLSGCFMNGNDPMLQSGNFAVYQIALNPTQNIAYLTSPNDIPPYAAGLQCNVSSVSGILSGCSLITAQTYDSLYFTVNASNTFLYGAFDGIYTCPIGAGGAPSGCSIMPGFSNTYPYGITLYY